MRAPRPALSCLTGVLLVAWALGAAAFLPVPPIEAAVARRSLGGMNLEARGMRVVVDFQRRAVN